MNKQLLIVSTLLLLSVGTFYFYSEKSFSTVGVQNTISTNSTSTIVFKEVPVKFSLDGRLKADNTTEASIQKNYGDNQIFYENKDKIYFLRLSFKEGCTALHYLDKISLEYYYSEDLYAGCSRDFNLTKPLLLEGAILSSFS